MNNVYDAYLSRNNRSVRWKFSLVIFLAFGSCIGTDLVDIALGPTAAEAVIEEDAISLVAGATYQLNFRLLATDGSEIQGQWAWTSRNNAIATVADGLVTGDMPGQTWIIGTANGAFGDSVLVTTTTDPDAVATISIEGGQTNLEVGEATQLTAVLRNVDGELVNGDVRWSSSNDTVVSVDQNGFATGVAQGTASVTATSNGIRSVPFDIVVGDAGSERSGMFSGRNGYSSSGTVRLVVNDDGARLEFESDFRTQSGPGLHVYLSPLESSVNGGFDLGELKATSGMQTYELPTSVDPGQFNYAIIYCKPFGVLFGVAPLE